MAETKKILERSEIALKDRWAVEDMYPTDEAWMEDLEKLKTLSAEIAAFSGKLGQDAKTLLAFAQKTEEAGVLLSNILNYSSRRNDEDTRVAKYQEMNFPTCRSLTEGSSPNACVRSRSVVSYARFPPSASWRRIRCSS